MTHAQHEINTGFTAKAIKETRHYLFLSNSQNLDAVISNQRMTTVSERLLLFTTCDLKLIAVVIFE